MATYKKIKVTISQKTATASSGSIDLQGNDLPIDRPLANGGTGKGFLGGEYFLVGIGGCYMSTLLAEINVNQALISGLEIDATAYIHIDDNQIKKILFDIRGQYNDREEFQSLANDAIRNCAMLKTLEDSIYYEFKIR